MDNTTELPNPFTPLVFLPPSLTTEIEVARYFYAATLGAYTWDIALNLGNDYALLFKHKVKLSTVVYLLSRSARGQCPSLALLTPTRALTLSFILATFVFQALDSGIGGRLLRMGLAVGVCIVLSQSATALLFVFQVLAIWHPNKTAYLFVLLWLGVLAAGIFPRIASAHFLVVANYRNYPVHWSGVANTSTCKIAVCTNIVILVMVKLPNIPPTYHAMLAIPGLTLINVMACLVFREIKFGFLTSDGAVNTNSRSMPHHRRPAPTGPQSVSIEFDVRVQTDIEQFEDEIDGRVNSKVNALA
ncbi:hypothetical protein K438DRAFT_1788742 [Mycena galopus ATCC 62051]|nr:hypothetical protein K438DRAFT_1788742 [Mycena galopus ATCC 62051]